ncbi:MAG: superoxide dismutase family protein [Bdellovibrionota bacterium]
MTLFKKALTFGSLLSLSVLAQQNSAPRTAHAEILPKSGSSIRGSIGIEEDKDSLKVSYKLSGLAPDSKHGFHFHEHGDCSSVDATSAGPHYKKLSSGGGTSLDFPDRYAGDMPSIQAGKNGKAEGSVIVSGLSLSGNNSVVGRAVIVHGGPDDVSKKSAPRIGCGVVK